jgi:outer membrane protein TolC
VTGDLEALDAGMTSDLEALNAQRPQYSPASDGLNATGSRQVPRAQVCR